MGEQRERPRRLVLARHAQAVDAAATDAARELSPRGRRDAEAGGRWLAEQGVEPDHALVSSAVRTAQTWEHLCAGAGWSLAPDLDRGLYEAGTDAALDLVRLVPAEVGTLVVVGHNPTIGSWRTCSTTATATPGPSPRCWAATRPRRSRSSRWAPAGPTSPRSRRPCWPTTSPAAEPRAARLRPAVPGW